MATLKRQTKIEFSYKLFHADKALLTMAPEHAKLLYSKRYTNGWTTVGKHYVIFDRWNFDVHDSQTLISSYEG